MIYAEHPTCLSEAATKLVGLAPSRGPIPKWRQAIQIKRYARASDGRIYALLNITGAHPTKAWADVVTGTLFRPTDGVCWSSVKVLDIPSLKPVTEQDVRMWTAYAKERSKKSDWDRSEE